MSTPVRLDGVIRVLVLERTGELASRLRHTVLGADAVVEACPDLATAEAHLSGDAWDVLVAGPSFMHRAGMRRLSALHQRFPWVSLVLALTDRPRADLAEIIQVGADDLVPLEADDREMSRAITRAARITRGRLGIPVAPARGGRVITIASASGGCGKTFVATNAAEFLVRTTDGPVVLLDLDLQFGEVTTALRIRPDLTIADALAAEAEGHDLDEHLDEYLLRHPDGFCVLAAPRRPAEADSITPGDIIRILDALRARGAWVVIDTSAGLGELLAAALDTTDHLFVLATPDRPSLVNLRTFLKAAERLGMADANTSVVLNKAEADLGLDAAEMALQLGRRFEAVLPYAREVTRSVNVGVPLLVSEPRSAVAVALRAALAAVSPALPAERCEPISEPAPAARSRRFLPWGSKPAPVSDAACPVLPVAELTPALVRPSRTPVPPPPVPPSQVRLPAVTAALPPASPAAALAPEGDPPAAPGADPVKPLPIQARRPVGPSRTAVAQPPALTRPSSPRPARSRPTRLSTPPPAVIRRCNRGPPELPGAEAQNRRDEPQRAGNASSVVRSPPAGAPGKSVRGTRTSPSSPPKWLPRTIEESPFDADKERKAPGAPGRLKPITAAAPPPVPRRAHGDA